MRLGLMPSARGFPCRHRRVVVRTFPYALHRGLFLRCCQDYLLARSGSDHGRKGVLICCKRCDPWLWWKERPLADRGEKPTECPPISWPLCRHDDWDGADALMWLRVTSQRRGGEAGRCAGAPSLGRSTECRAHQTTTRAYGPAHGSTAGVIDRTDNTPVGGCENPVNPRGVVVIEHGSGEPCGVVMRARRCRAVCSEASGGGELSGPRSDCTAGTLHEDRSRLHCQCI
jgi:hypothetical protein